MKSPVSFRMVQGPLLAIGLLAGWDVDGTIRSGSFVSSYSPRGLELPPELLRQRALHLDIGVTHHRPKGAAWAQYVILVVFADYSANEV